MDKSSEKHMDMFLHVKKQTCFPSSPLPPKKKNHTGLVRSWKCLAALALPHLPQLEREAGGRAPRSFAKLVDL
jgi:hypothetical protein